MLGNHGSRASASRRTLRSRGLHRQLVRHLNAQLAVNLRADIPHRGESVAETTTIAKLIAGRDWLFADEAYHTDIPIFGHGALRDSGPDSAVLALAAGLADYGRRLSPRFQFEAPLPSSEPSRTTSFTCAALLGHGPPGRGRCRFQAKLEPAPADDSEASLPPRCSSTCWHGLAGSNGDRPGFVTSGSRSGGLAACPESPSSVCEPAGSIAWRRSPESKNDSVHFLAARVCRMAGRDAPDHDATGIDHVSA